MLTNNEWTTYSVKLCEHKMKTCWDFGIEEVLMSAKSLKQPEDMTVWAVSQVKGTILLFTARVNTGEAGRKHEFQLKLFYFVIFPWKIRNCSPNDENDLTEKSLKPSSGGQLTGNLESEVNRRALLNLEVRALWEVELWYELLRNDWQESKTFRFQWSSSKFGCSLNNGILHKTMCLFSHFYISCLFWTLIFTLRSGGNYSGVTAAALESPWCDSQLFHKFRS